MRKVEVSEEVEGINSIDEFLNVFTEENESDPNSFTAKLSVILLTGSFLTRIKSVI